MAKFVYVLLLRVALSVAFPLGSSQNSPGLSVDGTGGAGAAPGVCVAGSRERFRLVEKFEASPDAKLLRFELPHKIVRIPPHTDDGAYLAPTGVSCIANITPDDGELKKSYSPVSLPDAQGHVDLLVKAYPPRAGGGMGAHLCGMQLGDEILMEIKAPRTIHDSTRISKRWNRLGFVAGGTGVAPMIQMIRYLLSIPDDHTNMSLLSINRHESDILMRHELEELADKHPGRLHLSFSLTQPPPGWKGLVGRGSVSMVIDSLPAPSMLPPPTGGEGGGGTAMVMVCGTDGFVDTWAGGIERAIDPTTGKSNKVQGSLKGLLASAGFQEHEVYKF